MPDIDPAALSRQDSISQPSSTLVLSKNSTATVAPPQKTPKASNSVPRIDLEPLYTSLKAAIGDQWGKYKEATSLFILGQLTQNELYLQIGHLFSADPNIERLHNQLISAILGNVTRDHPEQGVAPWVSANDKPTMLSKPVVGDAAEQRLKMEVMAMPARDRRRLKEIPETDILNTQNQAVANAIYESQNSKQIKLPDSVPASAGGLNKTNWEPAILRHYTLPLSSFTAEFPDTEHISARLTPICYEESLPNGSTPPCAEYLSVALEQYIKDVMGAILVRTRSNVGHSSLSSIRTHNGINGTTATAAKTTRKREREKAKDKEAAKETEQDKESDRWIRRPLNMGDMKFALRRGEVGFGQCKAVVGRVVSAWEEGTLEGWGTYPDEEEEEDELRPKINGAAALTNGVNGTHFTEDVDDSWGWEGGGTADRMQLRSLLDECLAFGQ